MALASLWLGFGFASLLWLRFVLVLASLGLGFGFVSSVWLGFWLGFRLVWRPFGLVLACLWAWFLLRFALVLALLTRFDLALGVVLASL